MKELLVIAIAVLALALGSAAQSGPTTVETDTIVTAHDDVYRCVEVMDVRQVSKPRMERMLGNMSWYVVDVRNTCAVEVSVTVVFEAYSYKKEEWQAGAKKLIELPAKGWVTMEAMVKDASALARVSLKAAE